MLIKLLQQLTKCATESFSRENRMHTFSIYSNSLAFLARGDFVGRCCIMDIMSRAFIDCSQSAVQRTSLFTLDHWNSFLAICVNNSLAFFLSHYFLLSSLSCQTCVYIFFIYISVTMFLNLCSRKRLYFTHKYTHEWTHIVWQGSCFIYLWSTCLSSAPHSLSSLLSFPSTHSISPPQLHVVRSLDSGQAEG